MFGNIVNSLIENADIALGLFINQMNYIRYFGKNIINSCKTKKVPQIFSICSFLSVSKKDPYMFNFLQNNFTVFPPKKFTYHRMSFHRFHLHSHPPCHTATTLEYSVHSHKKIGRPDTFLLSRQNTPKMQGKWTKSVRSLGACLYAEVAGLEGISWPAADFA